MIKDNNVARDTQDVRIERLGLLSANIGAYGPLLGVPALKIATAETAHGDYVGAIATAGVEDGQMDEAFETLNQVVDELAKYYALVRAHLQEIIWDFDKPDDFLHGYGFEGDSPTWLTGLESKIEQWKENHDLLVAAADPRVVADAVMTELVAKRDNAVSLRALAHVEKRESSFAYDALHELFANHTKLLRFILTAAHLVWGDEDPRLLELGFQTKSGVWTEGDPEPEPGEPEGEPWPGPMESFTLRQVVGMYMTVEVVLTRIVGCPRCVLEREQDGTGVWEYVTEFDLEEEELWPFREKVPFAGIWHYRATPFNAEGEPGVASEGTVEVM